MKKTVKKSFLPQDIAIIASVAAAGMALTIFGKAWSGVGVLILLCWVIMVPFCMHGYRLEGHKGIFKLKEYTFSRDDKSSILSYLTGENDKLKLQPWKPGGGAIVEIYRRKGDDKMLARYFDYAEYISGTEYPLHEITPGQVSELKSFTNEKQ
ncbi:MAG: hypothetical protein J6Y83_00190 [Bacteroidales bacterium]|nr:hypothetical protein [Bacteroidales bacterium]